MKLSHNQKHHCQLKHHESHKYKTEIIGIQFFENRHHGDHHHKKDGEKKIIFDKNRFAAIDVRSKNNEMQNEHQKKQCYIDKVTFHYPEYF